MKKTLLTLLIPLTLSCAKIEPAIKIETNALQTGSQQTYDESRKDVLFAMSVASNTRYEGEKRNEDYWKTPYETLKEGTGDCDDKAILFHEILGLRGIESRIVYGKIKKEDEMHHLWCEYTTNRETRIADPTLKIIKQRQDLPSEQYIESENELYPIIQSYSYFQRFEKDFSKFVEEIDKITQHF